MRFNSRRADVPGYLEFIWVEKDLPEGVNPQAIALITDTVAGSTVSAVKAELCRLIEADQ